MPAIAIKALKVAGTVLLVLWMALLTITVEDQYRTAKYACVYAYSERHREVNAWLQRNADAPQKPGISGCDSTPSILPWFGAVESAL